MIDAAPHGAAKNASLREDKMPGVKRERIDAVGVLTLDEPASLNAMTPDLLGDLSTAIREMRTRSKDVMRFLKSAPQGSAGANKSPIQSP